MQKRLKTQLNQSEHIPLSTPAVPKEKTLAQVEMKIAGAEKTDMFRNEGNPTRKTKIQKEKQTKGKQTKGSLFAVALYIPEKELPFSTYA
jgi:hypothetical protein